MTSKERKAELRSHWKQEAKTRHLDWDGIGRQLARNLSPHWTHQLGLFSPMSQEPDLLSLWERDRVFFPRVRGDRMEFYRVDALEDLRPGYRGILEPPENPAYRVQWTDRYLIAVPGVYFDTQGGRLGKGGGFYDRYLAGVPSRRVGVAAECQVREDSLARETFDVRMDALCTELKWRSLRGK